MNRTVGILGATGLVGRTFLTLIEEKKLPWQPVLFAGDRSEGTKLPFRGEKLCAIKPERAEFAKCEVVFGAASEEISKIYAKDIIDAGALYVDNSSAFRTVPGVPLVVPEINPDDIRKENGIIANPNCSTIICLTALYPLIKAGVKIDKAVISSYQAVSGAGKNGIRELREQGKGIFRDDSVFDKPIFGNVIPLIGELSDGESREEVKMREESEKILGEKAFKVFTTCVRVPVERCHSFSITLFLEEEDADEDYFESLYDEETYSVAEGVMIPRSVKLLKTNYPTPLECSDKDTVFVGRMRTYKSDSGVLSLWCCGDQLRKGAASNAIEIARLWFDGKNR